MCSPATLATISMEDQFVLVVIVTICIVAVLGWTVAKAVDRIVKKFGGR